MTVKKPVPCSLYDIRGIQEWLDEMALKGLFLVEFNTHCDRATFEQGDPRPVRYRLDPMGKNAEKDKEREEPYAQMGWTYVDQMLKLFYVFSCDDPAAPELYSDPQSLALAMNSLVRRQIRNGLLSSLLVLSILVIILLPGPFQSVRNLLLWENLQELVKDGLVLALMIVCLLILPFEIRRTIKIRDTLAQSLPLKAKRRWNRLPFLAWYLPLYCAIFFLPTLLFPRTNMDIFDLEDADPARPWPTIVQMEQAGPNRPPECWSPRTDGYISENKSPFAPVQEFVSRHQLANADYPYSLSTTIRYIQANSPKTARWLYQLEKREKAKSLKKRQQAPHSYRTTDLTPFTPRDWPGLDRLEVATLQGETGQLGWTFAVLRDRDVLLADYTGPARWEDCLPLFLEALDKEAPI